MSEIFEFLKSSSLTKDSFNEKVEFLIEGFLVKQLITLIYADGGTGKSYMAFALAKKLCKEGQRVFFIDYDNPVGVLKQRGVDRLLIESYENMNYIQRSTLELCGFELVLKLEENAVGKAYKDCVFILDSLRDFVDINNDNRINRLFGALKNLREAGATVIILHHSNKDGKNYQGSNHIRNSLDVMYHLLKRPSKENELNFLLEVAKERAGVKDSGFCVKTLNLELNELDVEVARMSEYELNFTTLAQKILAGGEANKTELLNAMNYEKDDRTARDCLDKFDGKLWFSRKMGKSVIYSCKSKTTTDTTITTIRENTLNLAV